MASGGRAFYMKSGRNCSAPKGQARLVLPAPAVAESARTGAVLGRTLDYEFSVR